MVLKYLTYDLALADIDVAHVSLEEADLSE
jgi:hypothetical protein